MTIELLGEGLFSRTSWRVAYAPFAASLDFCLLTPLGGFGVPYATRVVAVSNAGSCSK